MARMTVTLKAELGRGSFYWVAAVEAKTEEEAAVAAEHLFQQEMEKNADWAFSEFEVSPA